MRELPPPTACLATITSVAGFEARVEVTHLPGIADPAGATVERALPALGYTNVSEVHIGKTIRLVVDAADADARARRSRRCASGCWRIR